MINMNKRDNIILFIGLIILALSLIIGLGAVYYGIWVWAIPLIIKIILTCTVTFVICFIGLLIWAGTTY